MPISASAIPSGITFLAALANSSGRVNADNSPVSVGPKAHSGGDTGGRPANKPGKVQPLSTDNTAATAPVLPAESAIPSGITFRAALANSSGRVNADNGPVSVGPKAHSGGDTGGRPANKPEKVQPLSSDNAAATAPVLPADQKTASGEDSASVQENGVRTEDGSPEKVTAFPDLRAAIASSDPLQLMPAEQPEAGASDRPVTAQQQFGMATFANRAGDEAVQADALIVPIALDVAAHAGAGITAESVGEAFKSQMEQSTAALPPNKTDSTQPVGKTAQKITANAAGTRNSDTPTPTDTAKVKTTDAAGTASDGSLHNTQNNSQPAQHSQADSSQPVMPKAMESGAAQVQPVPTSVASHDAAATTNSLQSGSQQALEHSDTSASALDRDEVTAATGIQTAKLVQTMSETEMRVGLNSNEFGAISIRTSVSQQQMLAQISLDHTGLSQAISAHVSSMQTKLGNDYGLDTLIQVNHQGTSMTDDQGSQPREQRAFVPSPPAEGAAVPAEPDVGATAGGLAGTNNGCRLDIRA